jgi:hypothetical protein
MSRTSSRQQQKPQDGKLSTPRCSDERPLPLSEPELREQYKKSFGFPASDGELDALTSFMLQMQRLRHLASLWTEQNAVGAMSDVKAADLLDGFLKAEPSLPTGLQEWNVQLGSRFAKGEKAPKAVPEEIQELQAEHQSERAAWQRQRNLHMWQQHQLLPVERRDEVTSVPTTSWLKLDRPAPEWVLEVFGVSTTPQPNQDIEYLRSFSMQPAQTIDRALRGPGGWAYADDAPPTFQDPRSSFAVEYYQEGVQAEALRQAVLKLNPRRADVWRLITAASLEAWIDGQNTPEAIWVDVRDLLNVMGYQKAKHGGYKTEHRIEAASALVDLRNLHIVIPYGSEVYPVDPASGKRKPTRLEARRTYQAMLILATDELADMYGNTYPMRWLVRPGEWIKGYPKQFAKLYRALVQLPAKRGTYSWAKAIGTELSYQYKQDRRRGRVKTLKVVTLLERACLMDEITGMKNRKRARDYFEGSLDLLREIEVCSGWEYEGADIDEVETRKRRWFEKWLECRVKITAPENVIAELP